MKWQNLYIPDLNSVFANPSSEAVFKLLDRIVIVCSGYPVSQQFVITGYHRLKNSEN